MVSQEVFAVSLGGKKVQENVMGSKQGIKADEQLSSMN